MALPVRDLLAVGLGAALGLVMIAFPQVVVQMHLLGRRPRTPGPAGGDYDVDAKWLWLVRGLGVACLAIAGVIGAGLVGAV